MISFPLSIAALSLAASVDVTHPLSPACPAKLDQQLIEAFESEATRRYVDACEEVREQGWILHVVATPPAIDEALDKGKQAVPSLLHLLTNEDWKVRRAAFSALSRITGQSFGLDHAFDADASQSARVESLRTWTDWWRTHCDLSRTQWFINMLLEDSVTRKEGAALELSDLHDRQAIPYLRRELRLARDNGLIKVLTVALAKLGDLDAIPYILEYLLPAEGPNERLGLKYLEAMTGETLGYRQDAPAAEKGAALERWKDWWRQTQLPCEIESPASSPAPARSAGSR